MTDFCVTTKWMAPHADEAYFSSDYVTHKKPLMQQQKTFLRNIFNIFKVAVLHINLVICMNATAVCSPSSNYCIMITNVTLQEQL